MIKKKVTKNVVLSAAELEYLANALKEEILVLRGQVLKAGQKYAYSKNKKVLNFIKNEEVKMDGGEGGEGGDAETEEKKPEENAEEKKPEEPKEDKPNDNNKPLEGESLGTRSEGVGMIASSRGNLAVRKRQSLLHVDEETLIMKYCELKAKLENLEEATRKRFIDDAGKDAEAEHIIDEVKDEATEKVKEIQEKRIEEVGKANEELDNLREQFDKEKAELEKKLSLLQLENENKDKLITEKDQKIQEFMSNPEAIEKAKEEAQNNPQPTTETANTNQENSNNANISNEKLKELEDEIARLKIDLEFKGKESDNHEANYKETKAEYKILQNRVERLGMIISEKDLEIEALKKKNLINRNSVISQKVDMNKGKNIFGAILKKTNNKFLNEAKEKAIE